MLGWQYKKVLLQLQESATDVLLTLKKRPKHTKIYGQLGLIKLPSKKRSIPYRWDNLPSPRVELFNMPDLLLPTSQVVKKTVISDIEDSSGNESDIAMTPTETKSSDKEQRLYLPKPRAAVLQRRHTICGDDLINFQNIGNLVMWHNRKINKENLESPSLRDKSVSFGFGLELTQRPTTLGITDNLSVNRYKSSLPRLTNLRGNDTIFESDEKQEPLISGVKNVRFDSNKSLDYNSDSKYVCNVEDTIIESFIPIPYADEEIIVDPIEIEEETIRDEPPKPAPRTHVLNANEQYVEAVNAIVVNREVVKRGRLDKSHSTPTYNDSDIPPAIEPRQQAIKIPPVPPRKYGKVLSSFVNLSPEAMESNDENKSKVANVIDLKGTKSVESPVMPPVKRYPSTSSLVLTTPTPVIIEKPRKKTPVDITYEESELLTPAKVKTLTNKKKNSLMAKRRKIPLKSLGTSTNIQGHLYRRAKDKTEVAYWAKLYFVLIETALYGFKSKDAQKADCVIYLSGFTISLAKEVYSKQYAFKVYHPKKTFYFAAETPEALAQWMEYIRQATMKGSTNLDCEPRELFSETECSEDEFEVAMSKQMCTPSPMKSGHEKSMTEQTPPSSKHYHLNFGSLKKFARGSSASPSGNSGENSSPSDHKFLGFFSSNKSAEKKSADIVPTAQFKTYKKVKESNGGLQLGATSMINSNVSDMYLQSGADNSSILSGFTIDPNARKKAEEALLQQEISEQQDRFDQEMIESVEDKNERLNKQNKKSLNYLHASNPNLLFDDFSFHSTVDFPTSTGTACNWDHQGSGMTLLDLMKQQLDEEKKDMYNKRVEQGIERIDERTLQKKKEKPVIPPKPADPHIEKIQKRSLPITPDDAQSFRPDDKAILYTRTKEGQKLRDFGYELIQGAEESNAMTSRTNEKLLWSAKRSDKVVPMSGSLKKKSGFNWMTSNDKEIMSSANTSLTNSGSFRKSKNKNEFKTNEKLISKGPQPLSPNSYDKSFQQINFMNPPKVLRKNSAPNSGSVIGGIPYFSKLSFSSSSCKEKKLLGSPKLHRFDCQLSESLSGTGLK